MDSAAFRAEARRGSLLPAGESDMNADQVCDRIVALARQGRYQRDVT